MLKTLAITLCLVALAACTSTPKDLKSPCVGVQGSPCGPKHPVNDWWMS